MRKNGSRLISFSQYRTNDLFAFAVILALAELLAFAALNWFPQAATFTFSLLVPITLIIMMRWGWVSVLYAVAGGALYCLLHSASWEYYLAYCVGNALIGLVLIYFKLVGKQRIASKWYLSALAVILGWGLIVLGRSALLMTTGMSFLTSLSAVAGFSDGGLLSLAMGIIVILVIRRLDGLFEDQKQYLIRIGKMRENEMKHDAYGDELEDLDEEMLSILDKGNDLY
ncbi:MAG: hypothetical protein ACI4MH_04460 [Candidatus Coproplasma sp.]